jgi:murein DD-endopeptidase MepM/ murein hydrolase activator NlpD
LRIRFQERDPFDAAATGTARESRIAVTVTRTAFPVRHLTMKKSTERLYNFPGSKQEDALVSGAVRTRSSAWLWEGSFQVPTAGRFSTPFGVKRIRNQRTVYYHRGLDVAAPEGRIVVAPNTGRVVLARRFRKYGNTVILDHGGGVTTLYLHLSALGVQDGQSVRTGQVIGNVGMTGVATGPHLHWGLYVHGVAVNPVPWTRLPASVTTRTGIHHEDTETRRKVQGSSRRR